MCAPRVTSRTRRQRFTDALRAGRGSCQRWASALARTPRTRGWRLRHLGTAAASAGQAPQDRV